MRPVRERRDPRSRPCFHGLTTLPALLLAGLFAVLAAARAGEDGGLYLRAGDRSVTVNWEAGFSAPGPFTVERRAQDGPAKVVADTLPAPAWADTDVTNGLRLDYRVRSSDGRASGWASATPAAFADDAAFLDLLAAAAFDYFRFEANPSNGMVRDRTLRNSKCSIAAVGFGLSAYASGAEHGWWTRGEAVVRTLATLRTFARLPQGDTPGGVVGSHGWFYHFLEMDTGLRAWKCELSSIDTVLLLGGVLDVQAFFDRDTADEREIRRLADGLFGRVDWAWMADGEDTFSMGWHPESGFIRNRWRGYNEAMLLYLLALGSADGLPVTWDAWTRSYGWAEFHGLQFVPFPPLFGHQYSHVWVDFRGQADAVMRAWGLDYFENSRRATLAQRAHAVANAGRFAGYGPEMWGFTASDTPGGYAAYGAPPAENEHGTLAPTAPGGSVAFAPEVCIPALRRMYDEHRTRLWGPYGFRDAFNPGKGWYATDTLGIDQGPILLMIENLRGHGSWARLKGNPRLRRGLERAGFRPVR
jgi:hypothetical protein